MITTETSEHHRAKKTDMVKCSDCPATFPKSSRRHRCDFCQDQHVYEQRLAMEKRRRAAKREAKKAAKA